MKVIVTGGTGFIGKYLVDRLVADGHEPVCTFRKAAGRQRVEWIACDITKKSDVDKLPQDAAAIFHFAAHAVSLRISDDPFINLTANSLGTQNLIEFANKSNIKRFIYASTFAIYGEPILYMPLDEKHPVKTPSFYGASKLGGEIFCELARNVYAMDAVTLRLGYVYGPDMDQDKVFYKFAQKAFTGEDITINNGGLDIWDFVYVDDVVAAAIAALKAAGGVYNIGSGRAATTKELAEAVLERAHSKSGLVISPPKEGYKPAGIYSKIDRAKKGLRYMPKNSLKDGVEKYLDSLRTPLVKGAQ